MKTNGDGHPSTHEIRSRRERTREQLESARLRSEQVMLESMQMLDGCKDVKELRRQQRLVTEQIKIQSLYENLMLLTDYDEFGGSDMMAELMRRRGQDGTTWLPISVKSDRRHGSDWPVFRTEQEQWQYRSASRALLAMNSYAQDLLKNMRNHIIGEGFSYELEMKKELSGNVRSMDDGQLRDIKIIQQAGQRVIDDFLKRNQWNGRIDPANCYLVQDTREQEGFCRALRDGETFIRFFFQDDGITDVRFAEPECVVNKPDESQETGWTFGIQHPMTPFEDVETRLNYWVAFMDMSTVHGLDPQKALQLGEVVPANEILHIKCNTDRNVKRGLPSFTYDTLAALQRAAILQRNLSKGAAIRAATAETWKHLIGTQAQIGNMASGLAGGRQYTDSVTGQPRTAERVVPGTIRRIPAGQEPVVIPDRDSAGYLAAAQGDLRQACAAFNAPEYFTADASNANYSSSMEGAAPFTKNAKAEQSIYKAAYAAVIYKALEHAVEDGVLDSRTLEWFEVKVTAPAIVHKDELQAAQADQTLVAINAKSPQECSRERGLDAEQMLADIQEIHDRLGNDAGAALQDEPGGGEPAASPFQESLELHEVKDDSGHEHDAKGRFGSGGSKKSADAIKASADANAEGTHEAHKKAANAHLEAAADIKDPHLAGAHKEAASQHFGIADKMKPEAGAKFQAAPREVVRGIGNAPTTPIQMGPDGEVIEGKIGNLPITTSERGLIQKVSKKTIAALESTLSDPEITHAMEIGRIKNIRVEPTKGPNKPKSGWTAAHSGDTLMIHPKTGEEIEKSSIPERREGGLKRVIHHEVGHGVWDRGSDTSKQEFADALKKNPEISGQVSKIVNVAADPNAFNNTGSRLVTESFAELSAMRKYDPKRYEALPQDLKAPIESMHERAEEYHKLHSRSHFHESLDPAPSLIDLPDVRQVTGYDCGAACTRSVAMYFGVDAGKTEEDFIRELDTEPTPMIEGGTRWESIVRWLKSAGLRVEARENMTLEELRECTGRGCPVICAVQDYGTKTEYQDNESGHYVIACGTIDNPPHVVIQDPSAANAEAGGRVTDDPPAVPDSIQDFGKLLVRSEVFDECWHDMSSSGATLVRFGIIVAPLQESADEVIMTGNPYKVAKRGSKYAVVYANGGGVVPGGMHGTKEEAVRHFQALEINVMKGEK